MCFIFVNIRQKLFEVSFKIRDRFFYVTKTLHNNFRSQPKDSKYYLVFGNSHAQVYKMPDHHYMKLLNVP